MALAADLAVIEHDPEVQARLVYERTPEKDYLGNGSFTYPRYVFSRFALQAGPGRNFSVNRFYAGGISESSLLLPADHSKVTLTVPGLTLETAKTTSPFPEVAELVHEEGEWTGDDGLVYRQALLMKLPTLDFRVLLNAAETSSAS